MLISGPKIFIAALGLFAIFGLSQIILEQCADVVGGDDRVEVLVPEHMPPLLTAPAGSARLAIVGDQVREAPRHAIVDAAPRLLHAVVRQPELRRNLGVAPIEQRVQQYTALRCRESDLRRRWMKERPE